MLFIESKLRQVYSTKMLCTTGVFARKPRPTQTLSVDTQYIPPWVSKVSSDIMEYGEAGNGNGNKKQKWKGKWKSEIKMLLYGTV